VAGVVEFTHCALVISLSFNRGLVIADVEHHVATPWGEPWELRETWGVRWKIQIVVSTVEV
jgi:hypothetical protein